MEQIQICFSSHDIQPNTSEARVYSFLTDMGFNTRPSDIDAELEFLTLAVLHMPERLKVKAIQEGLAGLILNISQAGLTLAYVHKKEPEVSGDERFFIPFSNIASIMQINPKQET